MKPLILGLLALCVSFAPGLAQAQFSIGGVDDPQELYAFIGSLRKAVAEDNRPAVADMMRYPIKVTLSGKRQPIRTRKDFVRHFDVIMNAKVKQALASQNLDDLFVNYQGVMLGNGQIWITSVKGRLKVIAVNN